jgi:uncharacterized protein
VRLLLSLPLGILLGMALGALGGGGSILAVPALVYVVGMEPKPAVTTSLVVVGIAALGGMIGHWRGGRVRLAAGLWFGIAGIGGSLLGSRLNRAVDPTVLLVAFSGLMFVAAWRMWTSVRSTAPDVTVDGVVDAPDRDMAVGSPSPSLPTRSTARSVRSETGRGRLTLIASFVVAGTAVGFMTGFFGVGGGFIIVPTLVLVLGFDMPEAVGTSLLIIAINSAVALSTRLATTGVDWRVTVPFTIAALAGALVGNRVADRLASTDLVRWFAALLVGVALYTIVNSLVTAPPRTHSRAVPASIERTDPRSTGDHGGGTVRPSGVGGPLGTCSPGTAPMPVPGRVCESTDRSHDGLRPGRAR